MDVAIAAALSATLGFAVGDVFTALLARKVSGKAGMLLLTVLKLLLYVPFIALWWSEFGALDGPALAWIIPLGLVFAVAYWGFNMAFEVGKSPALVGVVAGCFPAVATAIAIIFMHERPSAFTLLLLAAVLTGVTLIGLPENWRKSLKVEKGILLALLPMFGWGIFSALLHKPIDHIDTEHGWFVVQVGIASVMFVAALAFYNRRVPGIVRHTQQKKAWLLVLLAGVTIGLAEALQALALGHGETVITVALLGSYPAVYFLIAHKIFKEPLVARQWLGIGLVIVAIVSLSISGSMA